LVQSTDFIQQQGRFWMPAQTLGEKIGYKDPQSSMAKIFSRNEEELKPFRGVVKLSTPGGEQSVRAFDEQGCYIVAMLAKTEEAKAFRMALADFLQQLRYNRSEAMQMRFKLAEMQEQYEELRQKNAREALKRTLRNGSWSWAMLERMDELHGLLTWEEISRLFDANDSYCRQLWKRYREANGDFRNLNNLKMVEA